MDAQTRLQPSLDEFSLNDLRHTLVEAWRIICHRRWFFVFPFLSCSSVALILSLWLPREFTASTVIRREHDPILSSLMGKTWTEQYGEIRQRMAQDLTDRALITGVLDDLQLPPSGEPVSGPEFFGRKPRTRSEWAECVARGITIRAIEASPNRDIVEVSLTMPGAAHAAAILTGLRDRYVVAARHRTQGILQHVHDYYQSEIARCRKEQIGLQSTLNELERKYPGINPDQPDPIVQEEAELLTERKDIARKIDDLRRGRHQTDFAIKQHESKTAVPDVTPVREAPNPRRAELAADVDRLEREIVEEKARRNMTDQHPAIERLRAAIELRRAELHKTPTMIAASTTDAERAVLITALESLRRDLQDQDSRIASEEARMVTVRERLSQLERARQAALAERELFLRSKEKLARASHELTGWEQNIAPVQQLLKLEGNNRGIHFATIRETQMFPRPTWPKRGIVLGLCLAIGAVAGAFAVGVSELLDHSFRTARSLSKAVTVPIIECVDEILTTVERRRRGARRLVLLPAVALALAAITLFAANIAYRDLETPAAAVTAYIEPFEAPVVALSDED